MLRSPLVVVSEFRLSAVGVILAMAAALWLLAAMSVSVMQVQTASQGWWERFVPVVYVDGAADSAQVQGLRDEIEEWPGVAEVEVDTPEAMLLRLGEYLGEEEIRATEVEASMMPTGLIVRPQIWRPGETDVVARAEALEVRHDVLAVDAPEPGALSWIGDLRMVAYGMGGIVFLGLFGTLLGLAGFLRRCQQREHQMSHLLEVFGASPSALMRPTLWRGLVLGGSAGAVAGIAFLPWSLAVDKLAVQMGGAGMMPALYSAAAAAVIALLGAVLGTVVAFLCRRPGRSESETASEGLLLWRREET